MHRGQGMCSSFRHWIWPWLALTVNVASSPLLLRLYVLACVLHQFFKSLCGPGLRYMVTGTWECAARACSWGPRCAFNTTYQFQPGVREATARSNQESELQDVFLPGWLPGWSRAARTEWDGMSHWQRQPPQQIHPGDVWESTDVAETSGHITYYSMWQSYLW